MQHIGKFVIMQNATTPFGPIKTYDGDLQGDVLGILKKHREVSAQSLRYIQNFDYNIIRFFGHPSLERFVNGQFIMYNGAFCSCCGRFIPAPFRPNREEWNAVLVNCRIGIEPTNLTTYHVMGCGFNKTVPDEFAMRDILWSRGTQLICTSCYNSPYIKDWIKQIRNGSRPPIINEV